MLGSHCDRFYKVRRVFIFYGQLEQLLVPWRHYVDFSGRKYAQDGNLELHWFNHTQVFIYFDLFTRLMLITNALHLFRWTIFVFVCYNMFRLSNKSDTVKSPWPTIYCVWAECCRWQQWLQMQAIHDSVGGLFGILATVKKVVPSFDFISHWIILLSKDL